MRKILYTALLLIIAGKSYSQQVIWSQDFEYYYSNGFSAPWTVQGNVGSIPWKCDPDYYTCGLCWPTTDNTTRVAAVRDGNACFPHHADSSVILMTPTINLTGYSVAAFKYDSYFTRHVTNGVPEVATVEVSTDGGNSWTVLKHPNPVSGIHYETQYVNLTPYVGNNIRLGFRYSDNGQDSMVGWAIDNLVAYVPVQNDLELTRVGMADTLLSYAMVGDSLPVRAVVTNKGGLPVTAFTVNYQMDNGTVYTDSISGVNIPAFDTAGFQISKQAYMATAARHALKMWVHANGDINAGNDSGKTVFYGASFFPSKTTVLEAGTGTWYPFAPQQYVMLNAIRNSDYPIIPIALHDQDPMYEDATYRDYLIHMKQNNVPFFMFDRHDKINQNKYVLITNPQPTRIYALFKEADLFNQFDINRSHFGFADISLKQVRTSSPVSIEVTVKPASDLIGNYRLALILTEDACKGTSADYNQANYYAGNAIGAMGGYETLPDPVPASSMQYNWVARGAYPGPAGDPGSLPISMTHGQSYIATLNATTKPGWKLGNMMANVLLLRASDSSIMNAAQIHLWPLAVNDPDKVSMLDAQVYPNPASSSAKLIFTATESTTCSIVVTDITGREVYSRSVNAMAHVQQSVPVRTDGWAMGMYLINIRSGRESKTLKLTVVQ